MKYSSSDTRKKQILFITGSIGLGHLTRDLAVVDAIRRKCPEVELSWLAYKSLIPILEQEGQQVLPEADEMVDGNLPAENAAQNGFRLNLENYVRRARNGWLKNARLFKQIMDKYEFDLVIGDEAYEIVLALIHKMYSIKPTFLSIYDFLGLDSMGNNPLEKLNCWLIIRKFVKTVPENIVTYAYIGGEEDVLDSPWGFMLPNRRQWARENCHFVGFITRFKTEDYEDKNQIREELGFGKEPLILCSIGGTAVGGELLELCGKTYPSLKAEIPDLRMVLVCGPRLNPESIQIPDGPEILGYVPDLYKHFAACDLAIVQGGGTSTLELTALKKPFLYFPLENHYEQQVYIVGRQERLQAGVKMRYSDTTPESLARAVLANIDRRPDYPPINLDGAQNIAEMVKNLLSKNG